MPAAFRWLDPILNPMACLPPPSGETSPEKADALLRRLENMLRHRLRHTTSGQKTSPLKGQGLDFADLREYQPGDDIRKMDWSVLARTLTPHVREYIEEKQLTLWLVVDLTPSMHFGKKRSKAHQAIELACLFGLLAQQAGHQLGGLIIHPERNTILPPKAGNSQLQQMTQQWLHWRDREAGFSTPTKDIQPDTHLTDAFAQLARLVSKQASVVVVSDFLCDTPQWQNTLGPLAQRTQLFALQVHDPTEHCLPAGLGRLSLYCPETGQAIEVDTHDPAFRGNYQAAAQVQSQQTLAWLNRIGTAIPASTESGPLDILFQLWSKQKPGSRGATPC
jgi:uncharacterized protein (DUF58 family)